MRNEKVVRPGSLGISGVPYKEKLSYLLKPVRGYGLVEEVVGKGWEDIIFPWFYGLENRRRAGS